jgi:hypothetical protein
VIRILLPLQPLLKSAPKYRSFDLVAQSVEHLTFNQGVMGSSPIEITFLKVALAGFGLARAFFMSLDRGFPLSHLSCRSASIYTTVLN